MQRHKLLEFIYGIDEEEFERLSNLIETDILDREQEIMEEYETQLDSEEAKEYKNIIEKLKTL